MTNDTLVKGSLLKGDDLIGEYKKRKKTTIRKSIPIEQDIPEGCRSLSSMFVVQIRRWCFGGNENTVNPSGTLCSIQLANLGAAFSYFWIVSLRYISDIERLGVLKILRRSSATSAFMLCLGT